MVLADSDGISRAPPYSGAHTERTLRFAYGPFTLYGASFQRLRLRKILITLPEGARPLHDVSHDTPDATIGSYTSEV